MDLTDEQWQIVETILPPDRVRADRRGRPWSDRRTALNGILWILRTGAPWKDLPERVIGDKAYDSDALDSEVLQQFGAEMIAPHRQGRRADRITQDGRPLRRFKRRWKVERLFAWLYNFRRLVVRYEYHSENYLG